MLLDFPPWLLANSFSTSSNPLLIHGLLLGAGDSSNKMQGQQNNFASRANQLFRPSVVLLEVLYFCGLDHVVSVLFFHSLLSSANVIWSNCSLEMLCSRKYWSQGKWKIVNFHFPSVKFRAKKVVNDYKSYFNGTDDPKTQWKLDAGLLSRCTPTTHCISNAEKNKAVFNMLQRPKSLWLRYNTHTLTRSHSSLPRHTYEFVIYDHS